MTLSFTSSNLTGTAQAERRKNKKQYQVIFIVRWNFAGTGETRYSIFIKERVTFT